MKWMFELTLECSRDIRVGSVGKTGIHLNSVDWWVAFVGYGNGKGRISGWQSLNYFAKRYLTVYETKCPIDICVNKDCVSFHLVELKSPGKCRWLEFTCNSCSNTVWYQEIDHTNSNTQKGNRNVQTFICKFIRKKKKNVFQMKEIIKSSFERNKNIHLHFIQLMAMTMTMVMANGMVCRIVVEMK